MKANDLMIGDYISVKPSGMPIKVAAVHHKKVAYHAVVNKLAWVRESLLEPIPLTPEILEKNFESEDNIFGYHTYVLNQDFAVENRGNRYCLVRKCMSTSTFWICDIQYVHELQHALKLCGIEKDIEL